MVARNFTTSLPRALLVITTLAFASAIDLDSVHQKLRDDAFVGTLEAQLLNCSDGRQLARCSELDYMHRTSSLLRTLQSKTEGKPFQIETDHSSYSSQFQTKIVLGT